MKQEDEQEVDKKLDPVESLKEESKVEDTFSTQKAAERSIEVASKDEANQQILPEETETEPGEKLENVLHVTPEETETESASRDATNITCTEREGVIQDLEETSETENKGDNVKNTDNANDPEKEV